MTQTFTIAVTWSQDFKKRLAIAPLGIHQSNKKRSAPQVSLNFAVNLPLRQLKQTRFCWHFNNWQATATLPISIANLTESQIAQFHHNNNAHLWREIRKVWIVWRSVPNRYKNLQPAHGRKQTTLVSNSHATNTPQWKAISEPMQQIDYLLGTADRWNKIKINNETHRSIQLKASKLRPML